VTDTVEPRDAAPGGGAPDPAPAAAAAPAKADPGDRRLRRLAELLALTGFAIAQPVLDITGRSPDFFLFRQPSTAQLWLLVALIALAPPLAGFAVECLVGLVSRTAERVVHLVGCAGLLAIIAVQVGKQAGFFGRRLAAVAFVAGVALAVLMARSQRVRQALAYASPAPLVFVLVFALTAPAGSLLRPAKAGEGLGPSATKRPPVVVLVFDEFPTRALLTSDGKIDKTLYPNFARLAAASTWYPNASGLAGFTPYAVPPVLTGRYPTGKMAPAYVEYPDNLFTLLGDAYRINAYESISQLCPPQFCEDVAAGRATGFKPLLGDTLDVALEVVSPRKPAEREGSEFAEQPDEPPAKGELDVRFRFGQAKTMQPERVTKFLEGLGGPADKPTLDFLHLLLPHIPFRYLPSGLRYQEHRPSFPLGRAMIGNTQRRNPEQGALTVQQQRMMLQTAYLDGLLGQIIDRMDQAGIWDEAVLVVTADHGEGFTAGEKARALDANNAADLAYVPVFVKGPGVAAGKVDDRNVMNIDLLPTIADVLDVKVPFKVDGVSLLGEPRQGSQKQWHDTPGQPLMIDGARWAPVVRKGYAPELLRPELGTKGLFAPKQVGALFGKKLDTLTVGAPAGITATSLHPDGWGAVDKKSGLVPALLWGDLSGPAADAPTWLAISVNGTVAGGAFAAADRQGGGWHFVGLADDALFTDGANDVRLFVVRGETLHPIDWAK
jgi:hypothetical protein